MKRMRFLGYLVALAVAASTAGTRTRASAQEIKTRPQADQTSSPHVDASAPRPVASEPAAGIVSFRENFDGVTPPALPGGWTATITPAADAAIWVTTATGSASQPNNAFGADVSHITDNTLDDPTIFADPIANRRAVAFRSSYNLETDYDGGVLEIKIASDPFADIVTAGGSFVSNGYNRTISVNFGNPLAGRQAWSGNSSGYLTSVALLPPSHVGQNVTLRWRLGTDNSFSAPGWHVDSVRIIRWPHWESDFNYDAKADRTVFRPSTGTWYTSLTGGSATATGWGVSTDIDVAADYDGDGKADVAVWRPSDGTWYIIQSATGTVRATTWGVSGDIPLAGDLDSDGKDDLVIYRAGSWYFNKSGGSTAYLGWGTGTDLPLLEDFDGDGVMDPTVFRPSNGFWYSYLSGGGALVFGWGQNLDIPVPGDYDSDGKSDVAIFRPSTGQWFISNSSDGSATVTTWGQSGDIPVTGDFDGDARTDFSVFRPSDGHWYTLFAKGGAADVLWGTSGDRPTGRRPGS